MRVLLGSRVGRTFWPTIVVCLLTGIWSFTEPASAQATETTLVDAPPLAAAIPELDGRQFKAAIVRADADLDAGTRPLADQLLFRDGKFSSAVCKRYNFAAAPYWVRREGNDIHFLTELIGPTDGKMTWKGTIRGDALEATMRWTKKRWYWTIDTEHQIRGKLEISDPTTSAVQ